MMSSVSRFVHLTLTLLTLNDLLQTTIMHYTFNNYCAIYIPEVRYATSAFNAVRVYYRFCNSGWYIDRIGAIVE